MNRLDAIKTIAAGLIGLKGCAASVIASAAAPAKERPARTPSPIERLPPSVSLVDAEVDPAARQAFVEVRLSSAVVNTVVVSLVTRDGSDMLPARRALADRNFQPINRLIVFRPGDDPVRSVAVPLLGGAEGQWFEVIIPERVEGAAAVATTARVTFRKGAVNAGQMYRQRAPRRAQRRGAPIFELNTRDFRATESGMIDGAVCWRSRFTHGRTQVGNQEIGLYTDPAQHPGARPFEVRDGLLVLRAEKLAEPILYRPENRRYAYGASVLTSEKLFSRTYGYFEWDVRLPIARGSWPGLWLLPVNGAWPPEIDVMEAPRNGQYGKADSNAGQHWMAGPEHRSMSGRMALDRLLGRPIDLVDDFHRHAVDWRADFVTWFIDDEEVWQAPTHFHQPAMALMDVAVGGWGGDPDFTTGSTEMLVRSFRVWA